ncbi:MAG: BlaI/MecI/CopY family transcriptional regulator [Saprospiraceae bacterium]|nr:BlaI/MecI/CopY family transcriptional regulator [Saprospiraceae bacterium]
MKRKLTRAEEEVMQLFWEKGPSLVSSLIDSMPEPKPAHSTISTIVRILEKKGFLDHKAYGKTYEYFPIITKNAYSKFSLKGLIKNYFEGSANALVNFLVEENALSLAELEELKKDIEEKLKDE